MMQYTKLEWPEYQQYEEEPWWDDEAFVTYHNGSPVAFVPKSRVKEGRNTNTKI